MSEDRRNRPPVPRLIGVSTEPLYRAVVARRNRAFDRGERVQRVTAPVISVGNLSVGGTGKTPVVAMIVSRLRDAGHTPGIAMRGYKAAPGSQSDEEREYRSSCPGVPVVAQPDRVAGATTLIERHACNCVVLDDGFQHRFLARDLDVVLLDATRDVFSDRCLPAGWLREPVESLHRAQVAILTHAETASDHAVATMSDTLRARFPELTVVVTEHRWSGFIDLHGERRESQSLRNQEVTLASGIGNPSAFEAMARREGITVTNHMIMPDHHHWSVADLDRLDRLSGDLPVLTTRKDWVKIERINHKLLDRILVAEVAIRVREGGAALREAILNAVRPAADGP